MEVPKGLNFAHLLYGLVPGLEKYLPAPVFFALLVMLLLGGAFYLGTKEWRFVPGWLKGMVEFAIELMDRYVRAILGRRDSEVLPFVWALFTLILACNLSGLIPGFEAPTASWSTTVALAITAVIYYHLQGVRKRGLKEYVKSFVHGVRLPGALGLVLSVGLWGLLFVIEMADHIMARPFSLSVRLFMNMFAKEMTLHNFYALPAMTGLSWGMLFTVIPGLMLLVGITLFIGIIASFIQALIFTTLALVWYQMAVGLEGH